LVVDQVILRQLHVLNGCKVDAAVAIDAIAKIEAALEAVRPFVFGHGGDITFVRYEGGIVYVQLHGACVGCPISSYTLKLGVEERIKALVPDVMGVEAVD
jgi:NFU1 iron-sulfur cluster scaffold homolog, mitochondrial